MLIISNVEERALAERDEPLVAQREILGIVAEGGFGRVYLARNRETEKFEALKVLRAEWACDSEARDRFLREAINAAAVRHEG